MATTDILNSLLRGELSATETYNQALEKFTGQPEEGVLQRMRDDHRESANTLRQHVRQHNSSPSTGSGAWGAWAKVVEGTAKAFGKAAALKALKEGEEHGVKEYRAALDDNNVPVDCKSLIRSQLLPQCQAHLPAIDQLLSAQPGS
jgi:rubrerythrin